MTLAELRERCAVAVDEYLECENNISAAIRAIPIPEEQDARELVEAVVSVARLAQSVALERPRDDSQLDEDLLRLSLHAGAALAKWGEE